MSAIQHLMLAGSPSGYYLPTQVTTGAIDVWLKADALTGLANNDPVSSFTDFSGNARHATATLTTRPLYIASATPNGKPALRFDGSNDFMSFPSMPIRAAHTLIFVAKSSGVASQQMFLGMNAAASKGIMARGYTPNGNWMWYEDPAKTEFATFSTTLFQVMGEKVGNSTTPAFAWLLGAWGATAGNGNWNGDLCEFIAFDSAISTPEYNLLVQGLKDKYLLA